METTLLPEPDVTATITERVEAELNMWVNDVYDKDPTYQNGNIYKPTIFEESAAEEYHMANVTDIERSTQQNVFTRPGHRAHTLTSNAAMILPHATAEMCSHGPYRETWDYAKFDDIPQMEPMRIGARTVHVKAEKNRWLDGLRG